jgi:hypothetical protein
VFREHVGGPREVLVFNLAPIRKGEMPDPVLHTSDVIEVGQSGGRAVLKSFTETLRDISVFGLFF